MNGLSKENKFLLTFSFALIALTVVTLTSVASDESQETLQVVVSERAPASIAPQKFKPLKSKIQAISFDLCQTNAHPNFPLEIRGEFVQVKGKNCGKGHSYSGVKIMNQTNGYTASIMPFGENEYQTDLIQLNEGENQILIKYLSPKGVPFERKIQLKTQIQAPRI